MASFYGQSSAASTSHKTHSSNPQSHSSWAIYLTLSVMDKYYAQLLPKRQGMWMGWDEMGWEGIGLATG